MEPKELEFETDIEGRYIRDIKSQLKIVRRTESSYVIVLAIHKRPEGNIIKKIPTRKGIPIGGYVYDAANDCYLIKCCDFFVLGYVPISFKLEMEGVGSWAVDIPVPEAILRRHLSITQKNDLRKFSYNYETNDFYFEFVQMLGPS